jgi:hypothetical protein
MTIKMKVFVSGSKLRQKPNWQQAVSAAWPLVLGAAILFALPAVLHSWRKLNKRYAEHTSTTDNAVAGERKPEPEKIPFPKRLQAHLARAARRAR